MTTLFRLTRIIWLAIGVASTFAFHAGAAQPVDPPGQPDALATGGDALRGPDIGFPLDAPIDPGCDSGDYDADGIDDCVEARLLANHAPILYMPFVYDWTKPGNVDWYLARVELRFHHDNCRDDRVASVGTLNQNNLLSFWHNGKEAPIWGCDHTGSRFSTASGPYRSKQHFFLQPPNDDVHAGSSNPADWRVYGHVYPNTIGGVNVQYWFFYPYNDNFGPVNHESDWEGMTVRLRCDRATVDGVYYCQHGTCSNLKSPNEVTWQNGHPIGWVADGSHATYVSDAECESAPFTEEGDGPNCSSQESDRWFTWTDGKGTQIGLQGGGVVNIGERDHPMNGQNFVDYSATWGEVGYRETTSGKRTPSFQDDWNLDACQDDCSTPVSPRLTVRKVVKPAGDPGRFNLRIDGTTRASGAGNGGSTGALEVSAGVHVVSETAASGTNLFDYARTISGACTSAGNVTAAACESKTCTITNVRKTDAACVAQCLQERKACMEGDQPGNPTPAQCADQYRACLAQCPPQ